MGVKIMSLDDIKKSGEGEEFAEFHDLSLEEKFDYIVEWMEAVVKEITTLAQRIVKWNSSMNRHEEAVKGLVKGLKQKSVKKALLKDILKGNVDFNNRVFTKESDVLRKYRKILRSVTYIV